MDFSPLKTFRFWKEFLMLNFGMVLTAISIYYFIVPSKLVIGSLSGLAILAAELFGKAGVHIGVSTVITVCNVVLVVLALLTLGREFGGKTVFCALVLGPYMDLCEAVLPYQSLIEAGQSSIMGDLWLDLVCFVLILSIAQAMLFNINASTGGMDIVAKLMQVYMHLDIGTAISVSGAVICLSGILIHPLRMVLIGLIGTWINGVAIDYFTASINRRKRVCIISPEYDRIRKYIIEDLVRGCSLYDVTGGYKGEKRVELQALLTKDEYAKVLQFVKDNQIPSFITGSNVSEIYGLWLSHDNGYNFLKGKSKTKK